MRSDHENSRSVNLPATVPLIDQYTQYLQGVFNECNLLEPKRDDNNPFCLNCSDNTKLKTVLSELGIEFKEASNGIVIDTKSLSEHVEEAKKNLVYLFVFLYLEIVGDKLDVAFEKIVQEAQKIYPTDQVRREKFLNKYLNLCVFDFKAHGLEEYLPTLKFHDCKDALTKVGIDLFGLLNDDFFEKLSNTVASPVALRRAHSVANLHSASDPGTYKRADAKVNSASDPGESRPSSEDGGLRSEPGPSGRVHHYRVQDAGCAGPSFNEFFYDKIFRLNTRTYSVPSGEALARFTLRYPISTEDQQKVKEIVNIFMIKELTGITVDYLKYFPPEAKALIKSKIDKNGNCKFLFADTRKLRGFMPKKQLAQNGLDLEDRMPGQSL